MSVRDRRSIEKSLLSPGSRRLFKIKTDRVRLLFIGFVLVADDFGRLEGDPADVVALFPRMGWTEKEAAAAIKELESLELISTYGNGTKYIEICNFEEHQDWHGISGRGSKIPPNPKNQSQRSQSTNVVVVKQEEKVRRPHSVTSGTNTYTKDGTATTATSGQDATNAFKLAKRIFRRYVGKSIGSLGNRGEQWNALVETNGSERVVSAIEIWAQELGKGGRNLNWPLAVFFANSEEFLEAAGEQKEQEEPQIDLADITKQIEANRARGREEADKMFEELEKEKEAIEQLKEQPFAC